MFTSPSAFFFYKQTHSATCIFVPTRVCVIVHLNDVVSYRTHNKSPNVISSQIFQRYIAHVNTNTFLSNFRGVTATTFQRRLPRQ